MSYLLDGELQEYPTWRRLFELIVTTANKPGFFTGREPFAEINSIGRVVARPAQRLEKGKLYQGGHREGAERALGVSGEQILYVSDHIYGDILRSKKASLWRTALIVEDLEREVRLTIQNHDLLRRLGDLEDQRRDLDNLANVQRRGLADIERRLGAEARASSAFEQLRVARDGTKRRLKAVLRKMDELGAELDALFNPNWGMVFKEARENSRFGEQVADYACIYTSRVSNFLGYSTHQYFRGLGDTMPHERSDSDQ
jgi:hypothetical protein